VVFPPDPAYYLNGYLYRDTSVYYATSGIPATQYQPHLGNLPALDPQLVNGIVYLTGQVRLEHGYGKPTLFALRPADGKILWQWNNCGQSWNIGEPVFSGSSLYFVCEAEAGVNPDWRLVSLQARTGALLWSDKLPADPGYPLAVDQQGVYLPIQEQKHDRLLAWSPATGQLLWQRSFEDQGYGIDSIFLGQGIVYVSESGKNGPAFSALATSSGKTLWAYQFRGDFNKITAVVAPETVYLFADEQSRPPTVYAVNSRTGVQRWHRQLPGDPEWPVLDQGNLYLLYNVYSNPQAFYPLPNRTPIARELVAVSGGDGHTLWRTEIPWNSHQLSYSEQEIPGLTFGAGSVYVVDWRVANPLEAQQKTSEMGAFSERNGALLWSTPVD
jgi:outer membrane protein assembly factor BamB